MLCHGVGLEFTNRVILTRSEVRPVNCDSSSACFAACFRNCACKRGNLALLFLDGLDQQRAEPAVIDSTRILFVGFICNQFRHHRAHFLGDHAYFILPDSTNRERNCNRFIVVGPHHFLVFMRRAV
jgi:hypothetical protein